MINPARPILKGFLVLKKSLSRREALRSSGALALAGTAGCTTTALARRPTPLGLAEITVGPLLARDYAGTLRQAAALGYTHFGFRLGGFGQGASDPAPLEKARMVRNAGMEVGVVRFGVMGVDYDQQIAEALACGATIVAMTAASVFIKRRPLGTATRAEFDAWLGTFAQLAAKCRAAGLTLAYHNHWWDFAPLDGEAPLDIMARTISPRDLSFEVDLAWAWYAGVAPLDLVARLGPRVASMHFKDIDRSRGTEPTQQTVPPGSGEMDYAALLPRLPALTSAIGYVEVDTPGPDMASAAAGAAFVRKVWGMRG